MAETGIVPVAYPLMTSLLDGIVARLVPPFALSKTEGDAVFAFAADEDFVMRGADIVRCINSCYRSFQEAVRAMEAATTCTCTACSMGTGLDLKFVLHHGGYVVHAIAGRQELLGPEVNKVHRLLKNHAVELVGNRAYALLTVDAAGHLEVPLGGALSITERYEHVTPVEAFVFPVPIADQVPDGV